MAPTGLNTWQHQAILLSVKSFSLAWKSYRPPHLLGHKPKGTLWRVIKTGDYLCQTVPGPSSMSPCPSSTGYERLCPQQPSQAWRQGPSFGSPQLSPRLGAVSIIKAHAGEMLPVPKCCLCKQEDLSPTPRTLAKETGE